ncbi:MAG TPA: glycosyltransferase family 2 protein [Terracidiphilus sp.]|nr:glycosyltransferase family 2 protein [Terracidiphilus sp.]
MALVGVEILLPVHNEADSIEATIREMYAIICPAVEPGFIVCEDGSRDNTQAVLRNLANELPMRLNLSEARKGYSKAVCEGMAMTEADYLLCVDSDGQCDPADFAKFWENRSRADVLIGRRVDRADSFVRRFFSRFFYLIYQAVFRAPVHDPSCPFVLTRREVAHRLAREMGEMREGFWWEFVARCHRHGYSFLEFPIHHRTRAAGTTQVYKWRKMPEIFFRHVAAIYKIWNQTRPAA